MAQQAYSRIKVGELYKKLSERRDAIQLAPRFHQTCFVHPMLWLGGIELLHRRLSAKWRNDLQEEWPGEFGP